MNIAAADTESVISDEDFAKFCEFFYRKTGIMFDPKKKYFAERRIADRMHKTGCATFREYFTNVRFETSGEEMQHLVNQMTVNETYFFREDYQLKALVEGILPDLAARRNREERVRLWSVPCSSGEEPYSLAIYILEQWADADRYNIEIMASDIDSAILAEAAAGVYGARALQRLSPALIRKYFTEQKDRQYRISADLRSSIDFSQGNVVDPAFMRRFRDIDVIFCRNMLIYFDDRSRRETIEAMYDCLSPGGFICLGHSESMSRISSLFRPRKYAELDHLPKTVRDQVMDIVPMPKRKARILVVEDGITMRMFYRQVLEDAGFEVEEAVNGVEGVERAMAESFDLLVVDVNMPKMDGYEVIRAVREDEVAVARAGHHHQHRIEGTGRPEGL